MARDASPASGVERLGRYEILGEIASGGMATVFLGRVSGAKGFQRLVAIKRLHPHLEGEEDFVSMFLDEARLAARIRHQNVVGTLDVEDQNGLYIVMEYIEGDRLLGLLRHAARTGERIPHNVVVRIALDTLAGLHAAHELHDDDGEPIGLVHRDVSPQNILIGIDGVARLTDFGIAKATSRLTVTRDGQLKGKIAYMAPEQTKRVEIDRRVDLFAMGIITWEMFTAKKLFTGESDVEVLNQLLFEPIPRLRESAPGIPAAIEATVMKALERDPAKRYASASEFADELERASKVVGGPANAKAVAAHVQKVSAEKLARDRARWTANGSDPALASRVQRRPTEGDTGAGGDSSTPVSLPTSSRPRTVTGSQPPAPPPMPGRRASQAGLPVAQLPPTPVPTPPPTMALGPSLVDDDEDVPTQAGNRTASMAEMLHATAVSPERVPSHDDDLDDGATMVGSLASEIAEVTAAAGDAARSTPTPAAGQVPRVSSPAIGPPPMAVRVAQAVPPKRNGAVAAGAIALFVLMGATGVWMTRRAPGRERSSPRVHAMPRPMAPTVQSAPTVVVPEPMVAAVDASVIAPMQEPEPVVTAAVDASVIAPTLAPEPVVPAVVAAPTREVHRRTHATVATPAPATDHPTVVTPPAAHSHPPVQHPHEDDPFGNDNPYQR